MQFSNCEQFIKDYRAYLLEHGITSAHVARKMGISRQNLNHLYGKKDLTISELMGLCNAVHIDCEIVLHPRV